MSTFSRPHPRTWRAAPAVLAIGAVLALAPSARAASPMNCDASALRGQLLGALALEPAVANRGQAACKTTKAPGTADLGTLGLPVSAGVLTAATAAAGERETQRALAVGGVAQLNVGALTALNLPDLSTLIPASLQTVHVDLSAITGAANLILAPLGQSLPSSIDVGLGAAIHNLVTQLPNVQVLGVGAATAYAGASCTGGKAVPFGAAQVADVTVLGQNLGANGLVSNALQVLGAQTIDVSKLSVDALVLPQVISDLGLSPLTAPVLTLVKGVVATAVGALPPITIPAQVAQVSIVPNAQTSIGGVLTQHALDVKISLLGQTLVDATLGEARVNVTGVDCTPAAAPAAAPVVTPTAPQLALQCTKRKLTLIDVYRKGNRVKLLGAADTSLAGRTVTIRFDADKTTVARTAVRRDGSFSTTARLPSKRLRTSNKARYVAIIGRSKSLNLKLARRMTVTGVRSSSGKVKISGRVVGPLGDPIQPVTLKRRLTCKKYVTVKTFLPKRDGRYSVTVDAPDGQGAAVYRLGSKVRNNTRNSKLFPTFTLPRAVNLL